MDLMQLLQASGQQDKIIETVSKQFGLDGGQTGNAVAGVLGALGGGAQEKAKQPGGIQDLMGALTGGNMEQYVDQPEQAATGIDKGNEILGQLLGSKDASRNVATQVEQQSGVSSDIIKKMMPMIATMAMGAMAKGAKANGTTDGIGLDDVMAIMGSLQGGSAAGQSGGAANGLGGALGGLMKMMGK